MSIQQSTTIDSCHISRTVLVPLMAATSLHLPHTVNILHIVIERVFLSQNCLFACDFGMQFIYTLTGWEGSATDARVFQDACALSLVIPQGKYLLGDAGFPALSPHLLVPYRSTRYHLAEWRQASVTIPSQRVFSLTIVFFL